MESLAAFIATAVFGGLVFRLIYERLDDFSVWLVRMQCKLLSGPDRLEAEAELVSVVLEVKGNTWKLLNALGFARILLPKAFNSSISRPKESASVKDRESSIDSSQTEPAISPIRAYFAKTRVIVRLEFASFLDYWHFRVNQLRTQGFRPLYQDFLRVLKAYENRK